MPAQQSDLGRWFDEGVAQGASHMIIKCDTFEFHGSRHDQCDYPLYVPRGEDPHEAAEENGDRTMEVYVLDPARRSEQIDTHHRVFNYE